MTPETSIIIRTLNEEKFLPRLLEGIRAQNYTDWEIILVDSGSRDGTLDIAARYTEHIVHIDPADFTFGRSLNLGCERARGRYLVLVSAHVHPTSNNWLGNLVEPFSEPTVAMVYGRQRAGDENRLSERMDLYRNYGPTSRVLVDQPNGNNGNAAVRRDLWLEEPFDESLPGLEDIDWARKFQQRGYRIYYAADAVAFHIHEESLRQVYRRFFREAVAWKRIFPDFRPTAADAIKGFIYTVATDVLHALRARDLGQLVQVPGTRIAEFLGTYRGHREHVRLSRAVIDGLRPPGETEALVVEGPSKHGLQPRPVPSPGPGEVLVQVAYIPVDSKDATEVSGTTPVPRTRLLRGRAGDWRRRRGPSARRQGCRNRRRRRLCPAHRGPVLPSAEGAPRLALQDRDASRAGLRMRRPRRPRRSRQWTGLRTGSGTSG